MNIPNNNNPQIQTMSEYNCSPTNLKVNGKEGSIVVSTTDPTAALNFRYCGEANKSYEIYEKNEWGFDYLIATGTTDSSGIGLETVNFDVGTYEFWGVEFCLPFNCHTNHVTVKVEITTLFKYGCDTSGTCNRIVSGTYDTLDQCITATGCKAPGGGSSSCDGIYLGGTCVPTIYLIGGGVVFMMMFMMMSQR